MDNSTEERQYQLSVSFERYTADGAFSSSGYTIESQIYGAASLRTLGHHYGIEHASTDSPEPGKTWFLSTTAGEDLGVCEQGHQTFHSLHVEAVEGDVPSAQDLLEIAEALDVCFNAPTPVARHSGPRM